MRLAVISFLACAAAAARVTSDAPEDPPMDADE